MLKYKNTSEIKALEGILGQKRAIKAMKLGLKIDNPSYNIYIAGESGTGKSTYALSALEEHAKQRDTHKDWCYVYNFECDREPVIIDLEKGMGKTFQKDIDRLIETLLNDLKDAFESEEFELSKNQVLEEYEIEKEALLKKIKKYGEEKGFKLKNSKVGMVFVPIDEDEGEIEDEDVEAEFYKVKRELENMAIQVVYKIRDLEDEAKEVLLELEAEVGKYIVDPHIEVLKEKYKDCKRVIKYLDGLRSDVLEYVYLFYLDEEELKDKIDRDHFNRYKINLFVDNGSEKNRNSAPVIVETNPSPSNLFGKAEYDYFNGNLKTDFTKLFPGAIHKANGGYLVLYAEQLLRYALSWDMLKRVLQSQTVSVDTQTTIKPDNMPVDIKLVLIGSNYMYNLLYSHDPDFSKYFKLYVDFDSEMDKSEENEDGLARFVAYQCDKNNLNHFTYDAVGELIKFGTRLTGDKFKISTEFNKAMEILIEGDAFSKLRGGEFVEAYDVKSAIKARRKRLNKIESKMEESLDKGFTLIETEGKRVGVINGLAVLSTGQYSFGRPSRISVTTSPGSRGIVNIEREVNMSGPIHNKGVLILGGYLAENFAQEFPLSLNAYICFEQNYGGVDGDSATCAETCALLSSISEISLKQNIAVTGSMNQKGEIQIVGGIADKVEGFYYTCKKIGLTGDQGVIIPKNNSRNLVLNDEVNEAIKNGLFKIYTVDKIEEAFEILTGYEFDEIKEKVLEKLYKYSKIEGGFRFRR